MAGTSKGRVIGVAVDGSQPAEMAYIWTLENLYREGDTVVGIYCYEEGVHHTPGIGNPLATCEAFKQEQEKIDQYIFALGKTLNIAGKKGRCLKIKITGKVGECILRTAKEEKVDFLVAGTRGLGKIKRALIGSVSDYLVNHADIPVIVFREQEKHDQKQGAKQFERGRSLKEYGSKKSLREHPMSSLDSKQQD